MAQKYSINNLDEALIERYVRDSDPLSLRNLAAYCNQRILEAAMTDCGMRPLDGEVENFYEILTDDDVSAGMRAQARSRLESSGVDVEEVLDDFISYQTVKRYLENHLDVQRHRRSHTELQERRTERIFSLESRLGAVTEQTLEQLQHHHDLTLGDGEVMVNISVSCSECGSFATLRDFIEEGGCECS